MWAESNGEPPRKPSGIETRECRKCGTVKRLTAFDINGAGQGSGRRRTCRICRGAGQARAAPPPETEAPTRYARPLNAKRYLITSAQNATPVHAGFLATLKVAAKHLGAELVVIPFRYKNPTSIWSKNQETDERWAEELEPYLFNVQRKLCANLVLVGDVKIQPTASSPLTGFESLTGAESCVLGHPKMQFRSVPAPSGRYPKILSTTGAVTRRNYTDTKAGKLGHFHHCLGAVIVELDGPKRFHLRQINADRVTGEFTDLETHYTATSASRAPPALGLVMGDTHARMTCPQVDRATFGPGGIVETLQPRTLVFHDLFDGYSVNPHHAGNPFIAAAKHSAGVGNVREEVEHAIEFVRKRAAGRRAVIVGSNHDDFLSRWVSSTDWRTNPANAKFYLETAAAMLASTKLGPGGAEYADPFVYWVERLRGKAQIRALRRDESFKLGDVECGIHGHAGPNGARGSLKNLSRIGARVIIAHRHTPGIEEGGYQVGTSTKLKLEYTHGPGSWLNTHCATYATGKRSLITIVDGRWRSQIHVSRKATR